MHEVFIKVMVIFAMIAAGFFANRLGVLPKEASKHLSSLLVDVTVPCLALSSIASQEMTKEMLRSSYEVASGSVVYFIAASIISYLFVKIIRYEPKSDRGVLEAMITSANTGFMGFPVSKAIFGNTRDFGFVAGKIIRSYCYLSPNMITSESWMLLRIVIRHDNDLTRLSTFHRCHHVFIFLSEQKPFFRCFFIIFTNIGLTNKLFKSHKVSLSRTLSMLSSNTAGAKQSGFSLTAFRIHNA